MGFISLFTCYVIVLFVSWDDMNDQFVLSSETWFYVGSRVRMLLVLVTLKDN